MSIPESQLEGRATVPEIDGYEIIALAGRGGMSVVYKANQLTLNRIVAIKMLQPQVAVDPIGLQRFMQEGRLAVTLNHENIASTFVCATTKDEIPFLVMEFLSGQSLDEFTQSSGAVDLKTFRELFLQVLNGLAYAHNCGIVHRDLKPGNIVLAYGESKKLIPKIVDFGIAKLIERRPDEQKITRTGAVLGSPAYMSPEQWTGQPVGVRSDIYSLGCVMYQALTGRLPYDAESAFAFMEQHFQAVVTPPSVVSQRMLPQGLDQLILKMLAKLPADRYASCEAVLADFSALDFDRLIAPSKRSNQNQLAGQATARRRSKTLITRSLVVLLLLIALCYYCLSRDSGGANTLEQAQKMFEAGQYSASAKRLSGDPQIDIKNLSVPQQGRLLQLEFLLSRALADDNSPECATMQSALREQGRLLPSAFTYAELLDVILDPAHQVHSLTLKDVDTKTPFDYYLQSLVLVHQALLAQREGRNAAAEEGFRQACVAARLSNRPVRELEVLNSLLIFCRTTPGQKANRQLVINDAHRVAGRLVPASGYELGRALSDLAAVTVESSKFRLSSTWALKVDESMPLPARVKTKMALIRGRKFQIRAEYEKAIQEYQKVSQCSPPAELFLRVEALLLEGDCWRAQGETEKAMSKFRQTLEVLGFGDGFDRKAQAGLPIDKIRAQIVVALIEMKSNRRRSN